MLSGAKNLLFPLRINSAKHLIIVLIMSIRKGLTPIPHVFRKCTDIIAISLQSGRKSMLTVTAKAKEKLQEVLKRQTTEPEVALRVTPNHPAHNCLELALDKEKKGDEVVQAQNGTAVLLISSDLAKQLSGILIDYREGALGADFIIARHGCR